MPIDLPPLAPAFPIRRRAFLAGMGMAAASALSGCSRSVGSEGNPAGWYAFLSDTHIAADPSGTLRGETMFDNLRAVGADILHGTDAPRGIFINGDLAFHHGDCEDYRTFLDAMEPIRQAQLPVHLVVGNHDHRANLLSTVAPLPVPGPPSDRIVGMIEGDGVRFVLLDSQNGVNVTAGRLGDPQLEWLGQDLDSHAKTPTLVFVHHNINTHSDSALRDSAALLDVIQPRRQVKAVVFGHTHVWNHRVIDGLHMINLPAIGYRFQPRQPLGWVAFRPHSDGAEMELRCVGGDRRKDRRRVEMAWRSA